MLRMYTSEPFHGYQDRDSVSQRTTYSGGIILECGVTGLGAKSTMTLPQIEIQTSLLILVHCVPKLNHTASFN